MRTVHYHDSAIHKRTKLAIILLSLLLNITLLIMLGLIEPLKDIGESFYVIPVHDNIHMTPPHNQPQVYLQNLPPTPAAIPAAAQPMQQPQSKQWVSLSGGPSQDLDEDIIDEPIPQLLPTTHAIPSDTDSDVDDEVDMSDDASTNSQEQETALESIPPQPISEPEITQQEKQQTMLHDIASAQTRTPQAIARTQKKRAPKKPTSKLTMSQLVQGFLDPKTHTQPTQKSRGFGNAAAMEGKGYGVPTKAQLVFERYIQRIVRCLQSAYEVHKYSLPSIRMRVEPVNVAFSLDAQGKLTSISIAQSSKNLLIDQFVLTVFNDASTSFPPVPAIIYEPPFTLQCIDALMLMSVRNAQLVIK